MPDKSTMLKLQHSLSNSFDGLELPQEMEENDLFEQLREALTQSLEDLIAHDTERLLWILYRVDIPEAQFAALLAETDTPHISAALADLIIRRQLEKIESRKKYRFDEPGPEDEDLRW